MTTHSPILLNHNGDVTTIDGFLATRRRLWPNHYLVDLIKNAAKNPHFRAEAKSALSFRSLKRNQTRTFVSLMDWATEAEDEKMGLGVSDAAMDFYEHADRDVSRPGHLLERESADIQLEGEMGGYFFGQFLDAVVPQHLVSVSNGQARAHYLWLVYLIYLEPLSWAARHWVEAGKPVIEESQLIESMKTAFPPSNEDVIDNSEAARRLGLGYLDGPGMLVKNCPLKATSALKGPHMTQFWDLGGPGEFWTTLPNTSMVSSPENTKKVITRSHGEKYKHKDIARLVFDFKDIPTAIALRFMEFMTLKSLLSCRLICKEWRLFVSRANIPPFRRLLLDFYDSVVRSPYVRTLPSNKGKPRRRNKQHPDSKTEVEILRTYFQTIPEILILWKLEWPGRTEIIYQDSPRRDDNLDHANWTFRLQLFLGDTCVGSGDAKPEFQKLPLALANLKRSPDLDHQYLV